MVEVLHNLLWGIGIVSDEVRLEEVIRADGGVVVEEAMEEAG